MEIDISPYFTKLLNDNEWDYSLKFVFLSAYSETPVAPYNFFLLWVENLLTFEAIDYDTFRIQIHIAVSGTEVVTVIHNRGYNRFLVDVISST
jgi:hypothetical protein